ncbi:MAG: metal-dependent hydrolase [Deinococcota bacterium]|jgi:L-ascorbate metabolism protein UlaG (beta-lactamase superfamily)|nr:metal-dependent hydrolase [Deinococcota bacterium]
MFLGQSGFHVRIGEHELLIDPFLTGNPVGAAAESDFSPSYIVLTHAHGDHYGDTETIAKRSGCVVISSPEVISYLGKGGVEGHPMNIGGGHDFPFGRLSSTPAWHSNSLPDGSYAGMPSGIVIEAEGKRVYHAGDTALFSDMALIGQKGLDLAFLPIGDNFTMGPADAVEAVKLLRPKRVVPIHYNTFDLIKQDARAFADAVESQVPGTRCEVLEPGESLEL